MKPSTFFMTEAEKAVTRALRARGLARQATEERQRLERMLKAAKEKEKLACDAAFKAELSAAMTVNQKPTT